MFFGIFFTLFFSFSMFFQANSGDICLRHMEERILYHACRRQVYHTAMPYIILRQRYIIEKCVNLWYNPSLPKKSEKGSPKRRRRGFIQAGKWHFDEFEKSLNLCTTLCTSLNYFMVCFMCFNSPMVKSLRGISIPKASRIIFKSSLFVLLKRWYSSAIFSTVQILNASLILSADRERFLFCFLIWFCIILSNKREIEQSTKCAVICSGFLK